MSGPQGVLNIEGSTVYQYMSYTHTIYYNYFISRMTQGHTHGFKILTVYLVMIISAENKKVLL